MNDHPTESPAEARLHAWARRCAVIALLLALVAILADLRRQPGSPIDSSESPAMNLPTDSLSESPSGSPPQSRQPGLTVGSDAVAGGELSASGRQESAPDLAEQTAAGGLNAGRSFVGTKPTLVPHVPFLSSAQDQLITGGPGDYGFPSQGFGAGPRQAPFFAFLDTAGHGQFDAPASPSDGSETSTTGGGGGDASGGGSGGGAESGSGTDEGVESGSDSDGAGDGPGDGRNGTSGPSGPGISNEGVTSGEGSQPGSNPNGEGPGNPGETPYPGSEKLIESTDETHDVPGPGTLALLGLALPAAAVRRRR